MFGLIIIFTAFVFPQSYSRVITNAEGFQVYDQPLLRVDWQ